MTPARLHALLDVHNWLTSDTEADRPHTISPPSSLAALADLNM